MPERNTQASTRVGAAVAVAGLQAEVLVDFPASRAAEGRCCGVGLAWTTMRAAARPLTWIGHTDLTAGNNSAIRAGPLPPLLTEGRGGFTVHMYIDHQILELIVNNVRNGGALESAPRPTCLCGLPRTRTAGVPFSTPGSWLRHTTTPS